MILPKVPDPRFVTIRRGGTLTDSDPGTSVARKREGDRVPQAERRPGRRRNACRST